MSRGTKEPTAVLVDGVVDDFLAPLVASGVVDLDYVVHRLKHRVAQELEAQRTTKETAARHLGRSERCLYRWLGEAPDPERQQQRLRRTCLEILAGHYPEALLLYELSERLHEERIRISTEDLSDLLSLYSQLGLVVVEGGPGPNPRVRATRNFYRESEDPGRFDKARTRASEALGIAASYISEEDRADMWKIEGNWTVAALDEFCETVSSVAVQQAGHAHERSLIEMRQGFPLVRSFIVLGWHVKTRSS